MRSAHSNNLSSKISEVAKIRLMGMISFVPPPPATFQYLSTLYSPVTGHVQLHCKSLYKNMARACWNENKMQNVLQNPSIMYSF